MPPTKSWPGPLDLSWRRSGDPQRVEFSGPDGGKPLSFSHLRHPAPALQSD